MPLPPRRPCGHGEWSFSRYADAHRARAQEMVEHIQRRTHGAPLRCDLAGLERDLLRFMYRTSSDRYRRRASKPAPGGASDEGAEQEKAHEAI
jgi:hypothetical protein